MYNLETQYHWISVELDNDGRRHLVFNPQKGSQSIWRPEKPEEICSNYLKTMLLALALADAAPRRMLFLGLGGGIMPSFLRKFYPETVFDLVEIDEKIPEIAAGYFGFKKDDKMRVIIQDGRYFVNHCPAQYDLIFLDVYNAEGIPFEFTTREFFQQLRRILAPGGVLSLNLAHLGKEDFLRNEIKTIASVFNEIAVLVCFNRTNYIVFAADSAPLAEPEFRVKVKALAARHDFGFDGDAYAATRLSAAELEQLLGPNAVILKDDFAPDSR